MTDEGTPRIPLWVDLREVPVNKRLPYFKAADNARVERILLGRDDPHLDRAGIDAVRVDGNLALKPATGTDVLGRYVLLRSAKDQDRAAGVDGIVVVEVEDWVNIPLENLIAARGDRPGTLYAIARSPEEAGRFRDTLEVGVHGIVLVPQRPAHIETADAVLREKGRPDAAARPAPGRDFLVPATVTSIQDGGPGDRVCVDTTSVFRPGEGLLVGSTARGFALVHAETIETDYVRARPFRVNAGAVHSYLYSAGGKTHYLSELGAGSKVLAVHPDGVHRVMTVGRAKIERRPHTLVTWRTDDGAEGNAMLQTAETIRLVHPDGTPVAVTDLEDGDAILVHVEDAARHFGMPVDESLEER